ncbi:hypothetical protein LEP1GSC188_4138 [Leptospira weilii serovar Topaz str. LT2116]|uniref:Uncharacterized protein n=1 Tax=Leptospira weilii serovar Topaz str. LT2116 TaxID=1088540 RepID=M3ESF4_9LEPT|nr:hypothetical protein LEP1GSC188_4138 [Leptospira weilii serovar Topaz str. LT2116]
MILFCNGGLRIRADFLRNESQMSKILYLSPSFFVFLLGIVLRIHIVTFCFEIISP